MHLCMEPKQPASLPFKQWCVVRNRIVNDRHDTGASGEIEDVIPFHLRGRTRQLLE